MAALRPPGAALLSRPHDFPPLAIHDAGAIDRARQVLNAAGYTKSGIGQVLDLDPPGQQLRAGDLVRLSRLCGGSPLETLIRLFVMGHSVAEDQARRALAPMTLDEWTGLGFLQVSNSITTPLYELLVSDDLILALPIPATKRPPSAETLELRKALASPRNRLLEDLTIRRCSSATLDMNTGPGVHALLAAAHSTEILAIDASSHAVELAFFNARLNGFHQIECCSGDVSEAVAQRTFDLVLCHPSLPIAPPPLIPSRRARLPGDTGYEDIVRSVPRLLRPGGYAHILVQWAQLRGEDNEERLRRWLAGNGCDAWMLRSATQDPASYAQDWLPEPPDENLMPFQLRFDAWLAYYDQHGIEAVSSGLLTLRSRPGQKNWIVCEELPDRFGPCGEALVRGFNNHTLLSQLSGEESLLSARLCVAPETRWQQRSMPCADGWSVPSSQVELPVGLLRALEVDGNVITLLAKCRGQQSLSDSLNELAASLGQDPAVVISEGIQLARVLLEQGFVTVVND